MGKQALLVQLAPRKRQVLRSDKDAERLDDKKEAQAEGRRRFQREGPITEKDLDMAMVVLVRGTNSSRLSRERRDLFGTPNLTVAHLGLESPRTISRELSESIGVDFGGAARARAPNN